MQTLPQTKEMSQYFTKDYMEGFMSTQSLRIEDHLQVFNIPKITDLAAINASHKQRLGHFAEQLFFQVLQNSLDDSQYLFTNLQIIDNNRTRGELDALIQSDHELHHIEFCYKIYLYDPDIASNEFACWIGPNRRDALHEKVKKLRTKQLPLFFDQAVSPLLHQVVKNVDHLTKRQSVCFLGQLYVPYNMFIVAKTFHYGQADGFYIHFKDLLNFENWEWYVPKTKLDWLLKPNETVSWMTTVELKSLLETYYHRDSNPLCWAKQANGKLVKCFVVNW
nr:DUF1853 family protein [Parvicella tangerina]